MGLFKRNNANRTEENPCAEKQHILAVNINKNWVICILAALVIILCAIICTSELFKTEKVAVIISFTATILSIVLSLLAILYSYFGNLESSENLSEIRSAVSEIRATENAIKEFISSINVGMNAFNTNMNNISNQVNSSSEDGVMVVSNTTIEPSNVNDTNATNNSAADA